MRRRVAGAPPTEQERLQLVLKLAALDDRYAEAKLAEEQYRAQRAEGKQRLLELTRTLRGDPWPA